MVLDEWTNLNGLWDYAIARTGADKPAQWDGKILVPFCVESALSGVMKTLGRDQQLWYRRSIKVPANYQGKRLLLHFGAVDWDTTVWVNGTEVGKHQGGYDPFTCHCDKLGMLVWQDMPSGDKSVGKGDYRSKGISGGIRKTGATAVSKPARTSPQATSI